MLDKLINELLKVLPYSFFLENQEIVISKDAKAKTRFLKRCLAEKLIPTIEKETKYFEEELYTKYNQLARYQRYLKELTDLER